MDQEKGAVTRAEISPAGTGARFAIDARRSRFIVQAFATGLLSAVGHNPTIGIRTLSGEVDFDPDEPETAGLRLTIQAASIEVLDDIRDRDRSEIERITKADVLEVARHPQITYQSSNVAVSKLGDALYSATVNGKLSFHGVTRDQTIVARIMDSGEVLRASGDFTLKQSDFQIKPVTVAGGALKLKDELKFTFEIIARLQEQGA